MPAHADLPELRQWNTLTIYNGWEQITRSDPGREGFSPDQGRSWEYLGRPAEDLGKSPGSAK